MTMRVRDVMGHAVVAVTADSSFADIVTTLERFRVGAVPVIDADRRVLGVVSEDDLLLRETGGRHAPWPLPGSRTRTERRKAAGTTAGEIMSSPAITVTPGAPVREAARLMHDHQVKQLPVIDPVTGRMVGTVHQSDLLRVFDRSAGELAAAARKVIRETGADLAKLSVTVRQGVLTVTGEVATRAQAERVADELRRLEGVVDVVCELTYREDDLLVVPPLL
jgi:CBS domain-containing protein